MNCGALDDDPVRCDAAPQCDYVDTRRVCVTDTEAPDFSVWFSLGPRALLALRKRGLPDKIDNRTYLWNALRTTVDRLMGQVRPLLQAMVRPLLYNPLLGTMSPTVGLAAAVVYVVLRAVVGAFGEGGVAVSWVERPDLLQAVAKRTVDFFVGVMVGQVTSATMAEGLQGIARLMLPLLPPSVTGMSGVARTTLAWVISMVLPTVLMRTLDLAKFNVNVTRENLDTIFGRLGITFDGDWSEKAIRAANRKAQLALKRETAGKTGIPDQEQQTALNDAFEKLLALVSGFGPAGAKPMLLMAYVRSFRGDVSESYWFRTLAAALAYTLPATGGSLTIGLSYFYDPTAALTMSIVGVVDIALRNIIASVARWLHPSRWTRQVETLPTPKRKLRLSPRRSGSPSSPRRRSTGHS